jgi:glutaredoxin 2
MRPRIELGETRSSDEKVETALARNARGDSVESTDGDAMSAAEELGAIKSSDEKVETALARDAREDSVIESTEGDATSATKKLVNPRLPTSNVRLHQHETQEKIYLRAWEDDTMSATDLLGETKTPENQLETATT